MSNQETNPQGVSAELLQLLTSDEGEAQFKDIISRSEPAEIERIASLITSSLDHFMSIIEITNGSIRVKSLLGISAEADGYFHAAISTRFAEIMTDRHAFHVAVRAMTVFDQEKKSALYQLTTYYSFYIACNEHGCGLLPRIITDLDHVGYKNQLLDAVASHALFLSHNFHGNFVVQEVLRLNDLRTTYNVSASLHGHCVELSFKRYGSYIVEKLLDGTVDTIAGVVIELLNCQGERLMRLARNEFGNYVVAKALRVTHQMHMVDLFSRLVDKLMPLRDFLPSSYGTNVARFLDSTTFVPN